MNESFKHFFHACQPEFKSLHGISWDTKPELYYQYLQTRYLAKIAESLAPGPVSESLKEAIGSIKTSISSFAGFGDEEMHSKSKKEKEHVET